MVVLMLLVSFLQQCPLITSPRYKMCYLYSLLSSSVFFFPLRNNGETLANVYVLQTFPVLMIYPLVPLLRRLDIPQRYHQNLELSLVLGADQKSSLGIYKPGNGMIRFAFRKMSLATGFRKARIVGKEACCWIDPVETWQMSLYSSLVADEPHQEVICFYNHLDPTSFSGLWYQLVPLIPSLSFQFLIDFLPTC